MKSSILAVLALSIFFFACSKADTTKDAGLQSRSDSGEDSGAECSAANEPCSVEDDCCNGLICMGGLCSEETDDAPYDAGDKDEGDAPDPEDSSDDDDSEDGGRSDDDASTPPNPKDCVDYGECEGDYDCAQLFVCQNNKCVSIHCFCKECEGTDTCNVFSGACEAAPECYRDFDCKQGEICRYGACVAPDYSCVSDADCDAGQTCKAGKCETTATFGCLNDWDCPSGKICVSGECRDKGTECQKDSDCGIGKVCVYGTCGYVGGCFSDADCADDYWGKKHCNTSTSECEDCVEDRHCQPGWYCDKSFYICMPSADACSSDSQCDDGMVCDKTTKKCVPRCTRDGDCQSTEFCDISSGRCAPGTPCQTDGDCFEGRVCDADNKVCRFPPAGCKNNNECPADQYCNLEKGICEPLPKCVSDASCAPWEICGQSGMCAPKGGCLTDGDCHKGDSCHRLSGKCGKKCKWMNECPTGYECDSFIEFCVKPQSSYLCSAEWDQEAPGAQGDLCETLIDCQKDLRCHQGNKNPGKRCYQECYSKSDCCTKTLSCNELSDSFSSICE